jgi:hypothetical protein
MTFLERSIKFSVHFWKASKKAWKAANLLACGLAYETRLNEAYTALSRRQRVVEGWRALWRRLEELITFGKEAR